MFDLFELIARVFTRTPKAKKKGFVFEGANISSTQPKRKRFPSTVNIPRAAIPIKLVQVEANVKNKDRIQLMEAEIKELREQFENQTELLKHMSERLSELYRDLTHVLPEK